MNRKIIGLALLCCCCFMHAYSQGGSSFSYDDRDSLKRDYNLAVLPILFYLPETSWGFGAAGVANFEIDPRDTISPLSQVQAGAAYTLSKQFLSYISYNLFWNQRKWQAKGEVGYYSYTYPFFGTGNHSNNEAEQYRAEFPRLRLDLIRRIHPKLYGGVRIWYDNFRVDRGSLEEDGLLIQDIVPGSRGGQAGGPGIVLLFDSRDEVYYTSKGYYAHFSNQFHSDQLMSDFNFVKWSADIRGFWSVYKGGVIATQLRAIYSPGDVPFNQMPMLGGNKLLRGYIMGKYRDRHLAAWQMEFRSHIIWKLGVTAFAGYGMVSDQVDSFSTRNGRVAGGAGLRLQLNEASKLNLRFDVGVSPDGVNYYVTFGEAF